jgi:molybdopterin synthase sulfur carrier subunit
MSATIRIPTPLRKVTNGADKITVESGSIVEIIESLDKEFPGIKARLCDDNDELRNFVNMYINGEDIRFLDGMKSSVSSGDEVSIVPAVAGGN